MILYKGIVIKMNNGFYETVGLKTFVYRELKIIVKQRAEQQYIHVLTYLIDFILESNPVIKPSQTVAYHSWILQFAEVHASFYSIWEAGMEGIDYTEGADYAIKVVSEQTEQSNKFGAAPVFPTFSQNIVISKGVYEGMGVGGVRYQSPSHMTGWWLTTELYDGNIKTLMNVHYYHVAFNRPGLLKYLALPYGYRFFTETNEESVWFDEEVLG